MNHPEIFKKLASIVGSEYVVTDKNKLYNYSVDSSPRRQVYPLCVVKPNSTKQVSEIVEFCNKIKQRITIRGGGSNVSGGTISDKNDIVLSIERLNEIFEINEIDRYAIAGAGVITQDLQDKLKEKGLWFPQNISSASMSCLGGNVAISSGSPKSLKYGSTKNFVLNLEVVLPNGLIMWTGKNVKKNATGFNLTQLLVGSEGTLGIITKVVLEVVPIKKEILALVPFETDRKLFQFIKDFFSLGFDASCLEFLDGNGCDLAQTFLAKKRKYGYNTGPLLWIEFESENPKENLNKIEKVYDLILKYTNCEVLVAESKKDIKDLWELRKRIGEAAINHSTFRDLDLVVPRSKIDTMYSTIKTICKSQDLKFIVVGHIGDGNFHVNIFKHNGLSVSEWERKLSFCTSSLFKEAVELGGDISGEHGVGRYNKYLMADLMDYEKLRLMKEIKEIFDPNNVLNSNNIFSGSTADIDFK